MMTEKLRAAAQAAYRAMVAMELSDGSKREWEAAVDGLRAALAEPEQEPVAFKIYKPTPPRHATPNVRDAELPWVYDQDPSSGNVASMWVTPVKSTPPQRAWVGLTDEEIDKAWRSLDYTVPWDQHRIDIAQAIEAKLREKNG